MWEEGSIQINREQVFKVFGILCCKGIHGKITGWRRRARKHLSENQRVMPWYHHLLKIHVREHSTARNITMASTCKSIHEGGKRSIQHLKERVSDRESSWATKDSVFQNVWHTGAVHRSCTKSNTENNKIAWSQQNGRTDTQHRSFPQHRNRNTVHSRDLHLGIHFGVHHWVWGSDDGPQPHLFTCVGLIGKGSGGCQLYFCSKRETLVPVCSLKLSLFVQGSWLDGWQSDKKKP